MVLEKRARAVLRNRDGYRKGRNSPVLGAHLEAIPTVGQPVYLSSFVRPYRMGERSGSSGSWSYAL